MIINEVQHNDLHLHNILVEELDKNVDLFYKVGNNIYHIKTKFIARIFDWDTSYTKSLKNNPGLQLTTKCERVGQCNKINPKFDLFTFLCRISIACSNIKAKGKDTSKIGICSELLPNILQEPYIDIYFNDAIEKYWVNNDDDSGWPCLLRKNLKETILTTPINVLGNNIFSQFKLDKKEHNKLEDKMVYKLLKIF